MTMQIIPGRRGLVAVRADASNATQLLQELQKTFAEFKASNEERLKGKADVVVDEKVDRINAAVGDLQKAIDDMNMKIAAAQMRGSDPKRPGDPEYVAEFEAYFRQGDIGAKVRANKIQAAANKGTPGQGGYLAPIEWDRTITDRLVQISPMRQIARVQAITTAGYTKLFNMHGAGSGWVGETAARPETTSPTLAPITIVPGTIYANPAATEEILEDSEVDIEAWLTSEVELKFSQEEGLAFVAGNGTNKPNGFLTYVTGGVNAATHPFGVIPQKVAASATAVTADELLDVVYGLKQEYRAGARWTMNSLSQANIRKLKDAAGAYLWQPSIQEGQPATLLGFPITEMQDMPNMTTGAFPIAFGNFQEGYLIVDRRGVTVLRDPYTNKPYVMFYMTKRVGGAVVNPEALYVLKQA